MKVLGKQVYRFDGIELDLARGCLIRDGEELAIRQKSIRALQYLLEQRHRLVTKEELIERVWDGMAVTDDALVQLIKEIRQNLGDDPRQPRFIKTIPKVGYRFIAPVDEFIIDLPAAIQIERHASVEIEYEEETTPETLRYGDAEKRGLISPISVSPRHRIVLAVTIAAVILLGGGLAAYLARTPRGVEQHAEITLPSVPGKKPIAVMHFDNQSGDQDLDWLREGLADMLITNLSRSRHLTMLGRQQLHLLLERIGHRESQKIRLDEALDLARKARAGIVVLGSFGRLEERIRVDVQLYDTGSGQLLTAERLVVEQPAQLLTQVDVLSLRLASYLSAPAGEEAIPGLTGVMTNNLKAYRSYSLGVEKANALLNLEAVELLEQAVALDPEFAMAYARIGYTYALCWVRLDEAKPYLEKAFQLSGRLTEKDRLSITTWYAVAQEDYPAAIEGYRKIVARYPLEVEAYWRLARLLRGEERMEEALDVAKQGLVIDSEAKDLYNVLSVTYMEMGRHDESIAMLQPYVELAPEDPNIYDSLGMAYQWAGRYPEAIQAFEKALSLNPQFEIAVIHLGNTYVWQGRYREALRQYQRFVQIASFAGTRARGYESIALLHFKGGKFVEAERAVKALRIVDKQFVHPSLLLALKRGDLGTAEKFMAVVEASREFDRGNRGYQRRRSSLRGYMALKSGREADALENFKQAVRRRPMVWYIDAFEDCLANAYLEVGQLNEAIAEYERILKLNPNYPLAHYHLGLAYERKGQPDQARAEYEKFLQVWKDADSDLPEIKDARARLR